MSVFYISLSLSLSLSPSLSFSLSLPLSLSGSLILMHSCGAHSHSQKQTSTHQPSVHSARLIQKMTRNHNQEPGQKPEPCLLIRAPLGLQISVRTRPESRRVVTGPDTNQTGVLFSLSKPEPSLTQFKFVLLCHTIVVNHDHSLSVYLYHHGCSLSVYLYYTCGHLANDHKKALL